MSNNEPTLLRSIWAVVAGFFTVVILSSMGDLAAKSAGLIPTDGTNPSHGAFAIFTAYRLVFTVLGGWVTARMAPSKPMLHALILGAIGTAFAIAGAVALASKHYGPAWYAWVLVLTGIPCTWLGAKFYKA